MRIYRGSNLHARAAALLLTAASLSYALVACGDDSEESGSRSTPPATAGAPTTDSSTAADGSPGRPTTCGVPSSLPSPSGGGPVGRETAGDLVTDSYGGRVLNVEEDTDQGKPAWEVEATGGQCGRIEVDVDKASGRIVSFETDD